MRIPHLLLGLGAVVMAAAIVYAFVAGDLIAEAKLMFPYPWFQVAMLDLYVGFLLFAGWIYARESSKRLAIAWIIALLALGNLLSCAYALRALVQSRGDMHHFWRGRPATTSA